ncbi:MAG: lipopolysaccharide biosynthesis protein [Roseiflexus sp.]|nr:lipopolysaccharide biosynthesis protein [Roseiflexus sp.]MCS7290016.1 lipopolysaccharide biosynthesis protein [Roseiflexus sp.]MDW8146439.1 lipopolysaccharide biosynthesis protein [Roseiflexaceae bacterium]MDW8233566.1 lipopolysaccharide biosynthesis protein [Roseiflexaceae bacterium]
MSGQPEGIGKRAVHGTFWSFLSFLSTKALTFATTIVLARLLTPAEFGIIAYCTVVIGFLDLLNNVGVGHALIARRDRLEEAQNAAFVISIGSSIVLYAGAWALAPLIADFFNEPQVAPLLRVLAIGLLLVGVGTVPMAMLQRDLRFKAYLLPGIARNVIKACVAVGMAWQGFGVWSLVVAELINKVLEVIIPWAIVRWRPSRAFDYRVARDMLGFGVNIVAVGLLGTFMVNVDYIIVGRVLGGVALGYYTVAYRIPELFLRSTVDTVMMVAFPVLSRLQADAQRLETAYFGYLRYLAVFTFPAAAGIALLAPAFFGTFYTEAWRPSIVPMQLIALEIGIASVAYVPGIIYKSVNRPEILTKLTLLKLPFVIAVLWFATQWGINGVAAGMVALSLASTALDSIVVQRVIGFRFVDMLRVLAPIVAATAVMALVVAGVAAMLPQNLIGLIVPALIGGVVYSAALAVFSRETLIEATTAVRSALARS